MSRNQRVTQNYNSLRTELLNARALFVDPDFPHSYKSLYRDGRVPDGKTRLPIVWLRPENICSQYTKAEDKFPEFIVDGVNQHDVYQGEIGNCWFIAAAAVLASSYPAEFQKVVPLDQSFDPKTYTGMFRFNFWWFGTWTEVIVDDYLPTFNGQLRFCRNVIKQNEFWPCLLEKAYAKLYGSYEALIGGYIHDALVDLTGGIGEVIHIQNKRTISPDIYSLLYTSHQMMTLMGASIFRSVDSRKREEKRLDGLHSGHAYSITGFRQILFGGETINLLRLRNPWGLSEWTGAWSDSSPEMAKLSQDLKNDLMFKNLNDGEFWMSYDDFKNVFDVILLCHLQPDALIQELKDNSRKQNWNLTVYHDAWIKGITAGGCRNYVYEKFYWINPQFYVSLDSAIEQEHGCTLIVSLMMKDKHRKLKIAVDFDIYKLKSTDSWQLDKATQPESAQLLTKRYDIYREVTKRFELSPGTYTIIPSTFRPNEESEFMLRVFTERKESTGVLERMAIIPNEHIAKDQLLDIFNKHAGSDQKMDASELCSFLEEVSTRENRESLKFSLESCRCLVSLMNGDKAGYLNFNEAKRAWKEIKVYRNVFKQYDRNNSNTVDTVELGAMLSTLGFPISQPALTSIIKRYGNRDNAITLTDFIMVICRVTSLFASFQKQQKKKGVTGNNVDFSMNEFLEVSIFT